MVMTSSIGFVLLVLKKSKWLWTLRVQDSQIWQLQPPTETDLQTSLVADITSPERCGTQTAFPLVLGKAASGEISWHCMHYTGRSVRTYYNSDGALARGMGSLIRCLRRRTGSITRQPKRRRGIQMVDIGQHIPTANPGMKQGARLDPATSSNITASQARRSNRRSSML